MNRHLHTGMLVVILAMLFINTCGLSSKTSKTEIITVNDTVRTVVNDTIFRDVVQVRTEKVYITKRDTLELTMNNTDTVLIVQIDTVECPIPVNEYTDTVAVDNGKLYSSINVTGWLNSFAYDLETYNVATSTITTKQQRWQVYGGTTINNLQKGQRPSTSINLSIGTPKRLVGVGYDPFVNAYSATYQHRLWGW